MSRQLDQALENMEALLGRADAALADICMLVVYVRNPSDRALARKRMRERFGDTPLEIVVAPVCRPGWLIEIEGMAILPARNPELPDF